MKQKLLNSIKLRAMLLVAVLCTAFAGQAWATTVTRTENFASSAASTNQYDCSSNITTAANQTDWDYVWTPSGSGTVFKNGIKLGAKSSTGTITNTTMLSGISTGTSVTIKVYAARWSTDTGNLTVTYNKSSESKAPSNSAITSTSNTYSSSDFSSATSFSITKAEDVTSFSIASSSKRIIIDKVEVVYDDGPAKLANDLSWSAASKNVTYSETPYNLPTLSNTHSLAITYDSSDKSVATVSSDGTVTIKNVTGSTNISAYTEGDATYASGTVSYTLNVTRKFVSEDGVLDFRFSTAEGGGYGSGVTQDGTLVEGSTSTWTSGNIVLTIANRYAWNADGTLRAYKSTSSYDASEITISCPAGKAINQIEFTGPYSGTGKLSNIACNTGTYTVTSSSAIWTGAAQSVTFTASNSTYINTVTVTYGTTVPVSISSAEWTSFSAGVAIDFTGVTAYKVSALGATNVSLDEITEAPANTPVLLNANEGTYNLNVVTSASAVGTNLLQASDGTVTGDESTIYALGKKDEVVGFYLVASGVKVPAGKAYLTVGGGAVKEFLTFDFGEETSIKAMYDVQGTKDNAAIYNLAGQRMSKLQRGINIVNGKKVLVK